MSDSVLSCHRLPAKMFPRLLWTATILAATLCDGAFIQKDLACPQGGYISSVRTALDVRMEKTATLSILADLAFSVSDRFL